ncbi:MAG TPA: hypothetical protein VM532_12980 [Burkholderiales bacterium]|nr:hypothetical protein [Burkholderiales bacterium]
MKPESLTVAIRPRVPYEAMDLGLTLVHQHGKLIYAAWAAVLIPVMLLATLPALMWPSQTWLWSMFVWWLKPLYDRVILHVLSRAVFGEIVTVRQVLKAIPDFFHTGLIRALTWGRLSLMRSFLLPVWQLEGLKGKARGTRIALLKKNSGGNGRWLTIACLHLEAILMFSLIGLAFLVIPDELGLPGMEMIFDMDNHPPWFVLLQYGAYLTAVLFIEPLYVAAGFALYLNRRTELESWDIELAFHKMAARLKRQDRQAA